MTNRVSSVFETKEYASALAMYTRVKRHFGKSVFIITSPDSCGDCVCGLQFGNVVRILFVRPRTVRVQYSTGAHREFFESAEKNVTFSTEFVLHTVIRYALFLSASGAKQEQIGITIYEDFNDPKRSKPFPFDEHVRRVDFVTLVFSHMGSNNNLRHAYSHNRHHMDFAELMQDTDDMDVFKRQLVEAYGTTHVFTPSDRFKEYGPMRGKFLNVGGERSWSRIPVVSVMATDEAGDTVPIKAFILRRNTQNSAMPLVEQYYGNTLVQEGNIFKMDVTRREDFFEAIACKISNIGDVTDIFAHPMFEELDALYEDTKDAWVLGEDDSCAYIPTGFVSPDHGDMCTAESFAAVFKMLQKREVKSIEILEVPCCLKPVVVGIPVPMQMMQHVSVNMFRINFVKQTGEEQ